MLAKECQPQLPEGASQLAPGILKLPIREAPVGAQATCDLPRGTNLHLHYTVHAYLPADAAHEWESRVDASHKPHHHDHHGSCCGTGDQSQEQATIARMERLLAQAKRQHVKETGEGVAQVPKRVLVRDTRTTPGSSKAFELRLGLGFSVTCMEECVRSMRLGEVSRFLVQAEHCEVSVGVYGVF
jgi:hypothetical protein